MPTTPTAPTATTFQLTYTINLSETDRELYRKIDAQLGKIAGSLALIASRYQPPGTRPPESQAPGA